MATQQDAEEDAEAAAAAAARPAERMWTWLGESKAASLTWEPLKRTSRMAAGAHAQSEFVRDV